MRFVLGAPGPRNMSFLMRPNLIVFILMMSTSLRCVRQNLKKSTQTYCCEYCARSFRTANSLAHHVRRVHTRPAQENANAGLPTNAMLVFDLEDLNDASGSDMCDHNLEASGPVGPLPMDNVAFLRPHHPSGSNNTSRYPTPPMHDQCHDVRW